MSNLTQRQKSDLARSAKKGFHSSDGFFLLKCYFLIKVWGKKEKKEKGKRKKGRGKGKS